MRLPILLLITGLSLVSAQTIYGLKSRSIGGGGAGEYYTPVTLFCFEDNGSSFTSINTVREGGTEIRADGLAYSEQRGLWCFKIDTAGNSVLYQISPATASVISSGFVFSGREIFGAAFDRHDGLWAIDQTQSELLKIDCTTGAIIRSMQLTKSGSPFILQFASGDIVFSSTGKAYLVYCSGIYSLNTTTGALTELYQDTTPYDKFLVGAAISADRPETLLGFDVTHTAIDNDDIFVYNLAALSEPTYLLNSILDSYNAGRGDLAASVPEDLIVASRFDSNAEGWTGAGLSVSNLSQIVQVLPITYNSSGYIGITDNDNDWTTFAAPSKYLGDKSEWFGGEITLDMLHQTSGTRIEGPMVFLVGSGIVLCSPWTIPSDSWRHFSIPLRPAGWHLNTYNGIEPTTEQMVAVLSNLQAMYIIGDFVAGVETTHIDNVQMVSGSSPVTTGLKLWLKADSLLLADGQAVDVWPDSSGNGLEVSQGVAAQKPIFKQSILNNKPVVRFDGDDSFVRSSVLGTLITSPAEATVFVVENQSSADSQNSTLGWGNKSDNRFLLHTAYANWLGIQHGDIYAVPDGDAGFNPTQWTDRFHIAEFGRNGGVYSVMVDGREKTVRDQTGTPPLDTSYSTDLYIGSDQWSNYLTGDIAEILVYGRALNAQELARVRHYLSGKYGFDKESQLWGTDFNHSGRTDLVDFAQFAAQWLQPECLGFWWCNEADMNHNGNVSLDDLQVFVQHWLGGI